MDSDGDERMDTDSGSECEENSLGNQHTKHLIAGKIATVHLKNFLTHTEATVHPSEQLNLVSFLCSSFFFVLTTMHVFSCTVSTFACSVCAQTLEFHNKMKLREKNQTECRLSDFVVVVFSRCGNKLGYWSKWNGKIVNCCIDYHRYGW